MSDSIQSLMEELGPGTWLELKDEGRDLETGRWLCGFPRLDVCGGFQSGSGDTPIEALTKLRDKVKPRTPEQVVSETLIGLYARPVEWADEAAVQAVSALRDAGMLKDGA